MKKLLLLLGLSLAFLYPNAQPSSQIKIQFGTIKSILKENRGYAYRIWAPYELYSSNFGIEFERYSNSKTSWFIVGMLASIDYAFTINEPRFQSINTNRISGGESVFFRLHGGFNNKFGFSDQKKLKFSLLYGGGLAIIPANNVSSGTKDPDMGTTINGEEFKSPYNNWILNAGYFRVVNSVGKFRLVPLVFAGPRLTTTKKNGKNGISIDAMINWSVSHYNTFEIPYTLNGVTTKDVFKTNGNYVQVNLNIPVYTFKKKRAEGR